MAWTLPADVKDRWLSNKVLPTDAKLIIFIADIERQILAYYPAIQTRIDGNLIDIELIKQTVASWVIEFLLTEGTPYASESQAYAGAGSRSVTYGDNVRKSLVLSKADFAILGPRNSGAAVSANMLPNCGRHTVWYSLTDYFGE